MDYAWYKSTHSQCKDVPVNIECIRTSFSLIREVNAWRWIEGFVILSLHNFHDTDVTTISYIDNT